MGMYGFTKLFASITESTIWLAPDTHRLCWITMLAIADRSGRIAGSIPGIANRARIPLEDARAAIESFMAPDKESRSQEHEGRRLEKIDGGWRLLNHKRYRAIRDEAAKRDCNLQYMRRIRAAKKNGGGFSVENVDCGGSDYPQAETEAEPQAEPQADPQADPQAEAEKHESSPTPVARRRAKRIRLEPMIGEGELLFTVPSLNGAVEIRRSFITELIEAYPSVMVAQEIDRATLWLKANPTKLKRNVRRFLTNWISRVQERGGSGFT